MIITDSIDMNYVKLKITSFNMPFFPIEPPLFPYSFYNYYSPNLIKDKEKAEKECFFPESQEGEFMDKDLSEFYQKKGYNLKK